MTFIIDEEIDWPTMLMRCFDTEEGRADGLGKIYDIDFAVPPIRDVTRQNILAGSGAAKRGHASGASQRLSCRVYGGR